MGEVKASLTDCLLAGYKLLHIDPTVDRTLASDAPVPIDLVVERTVELIVHAETERVRLELPPIDYEVGTEEVHGGLVDLDNFRHFIYSLRARLEELDLLHAWPCFIVGKVGTDLHTSFFDPATANELYGIVAPLGSLIKGHYTDWVENAEAYPASGMGGANVGPEFTTAEYLALADLESKETALRRSRPQTKPAGFLAALEQAVYESGRWQKWLQADERGPGLLRPGPSAPRLARPDRRPLRLDRTRRPIRPRPPLHQPHPHPPRPAPIRRRAHRPGHGPLHQRLPPLRRQHAADCR